MASIFEATVQVLLKEGMHRLTTTRVAERAGVSVGTLYQYYPNKQALLLAVLGRHLDGVAGAVEAAARQAQQQPLARMVEAVVEAFVGAKVQHIDEARALYAVAEEPAGAELVRRASARASAAIQTMLACAPDAAFEDLGVTSYIFASAMIGPTRGVVERQAPPKLVRALQRHLVSLCLGYLDREKLPGWRAKTPS
ncbi:HTH-type transcriptional repressor KstR [Variovorax sp. PBS-H4]|nr:HTH-type transcriptional repressor KstR [Variovorax sp. PBS-H4]